MKIVAFESFYCDSHKYWLDQLIKTSSHEIKKMTLPGRHWKWRMHGSAITFAHQLNNEQIETDLFVLTDMVDIAVFKSLLKPFYRNVPILAYFHENQLTYPWSSTDPDVQLKRNRHYGFINYTSALAADAVIFNSKYHKESFLDSLPSFLKAFPDFQNLHTIKTIAHKSNIIPIGLDLKTLEDHKTKSKNPIPVILWNHRWEFDKNPLEFFETLFQLKEEGFKFRLIVTGKSYKNSPGIFQTAKESLKEEIIHWGFCENRAEYIKFLWQSDILPVCSTQDFFGISVVEAIYCNCYPILPARLSYREHIENPGFFYTDNSELYEKLKTALLQYPELKNPDLSQIKQYGWSTIIKEYDSFFYSFLGANL